MAPGSRERALFITGSPRLIQSAMQIIMLRLQTQLTTTQSEHMRQQAIENGQNLDKLVIQWIIPQQATGLLIGKNGARIKMINERSGAWVKIAHPEETAPSIGERYVYIRGSAAQTACAVDIVRSIAGGRASNASDKEGQRSVVVIPLRAVGAVAMGNADEGIPPLHSLSNGVGVRIEAPYLTGISSAKILIEGPMEFRRQLEDIAKARLDDWNNQNKVNSLHTLAVINGAEGVSPGSEEENELRVKVEMCIVILVASICADLLVSVDEHGKTVFSDVQEKYGVSLELVTESHLGSAYGSHTRVIALIGPLGSLLHALEPIQAIMFAHHPAPVIVPTPTLHIPTERNRRNLSPEELMMNKERMQHQRVMETSLDRMSSDGIDYYSDMGRDPSAMARPASTTVRPPSYKSYLPGAGNYQSGLRGSASPYMPSSYAEAAPFVPRSYSDPMTAEYGGMQDHHGYGNNTGGEYYGGFSGAPQHSRSNSQYPPYHAPILGIEEKEMPRSIAALTSTGGVPVSVPGSVGSPSSQALPPAVSSVYSNPYQFSSPTSPPVAPAAAASSSSSSTASASARPVSALAITSGALAPPVQYSAAAPLYPYGLGAPVSTTSSTSSAAPEKQVAEAPSAPEGPATASSSTGRAFVDPTNDDDYYRVT